MYCFAVSGATMAALPGDTSPMETTPIQASKLARAIFRIMMMILSCH